MLVLACQEPEYNGVSKTQGNSTQAITEEPKQRTRNPNKRAKARHILISHRGAVAAPERLRRTESEAKAKAEDVLAQLKSGRTFAKVALKESDDPSRSKGGQLKPFSVGEMTLDFEEKVFSMNIDEMGIVQSKFGFHVVQRQLLDEVNIQSLIIQWNDSLYATTTRTKQEAYDLAGEIQAQMGTIPFTELVRAHSDGPYGSRGGMSGYFQRGELNPKIEEHVFALNPNETTEIIETQIGLCLIKRIR